jgi:ANTAR domain
MVQGAVEESVEYRDGVVAGVPDRGAARLIPDRYWRGEYRSSMATSDLSVWVGIEPLASVAQASGMVAVQAGCSPDEALSMMQERASVIGISLGDLAEEVRAHRTLFD